MLVTCGDPQGSILGPALFIVYIIYMCNVSMLMKSIVFADGTNFFYSGDNISQVCETVSTELGKLHIWFQVNKLSLNIAKTNFMIFGNKQCEVDHVVSINGVNINRVYVTKCIGVHLDSHLNWCELINHIKSKMSKNVSVVRTAEHLLINFALYSFYTTPFMPYLNNCCEIWGNTYKSRIQPLQIIQKRAIRICQKANYRSQSRPLFYQLKILNIHDMVNFKSMVCMYEVYNKLLPANIMSYFKKINARHNHNVRLKNCNFKIKFSRTTKKSECISVNGPKMWNDLPADIKLCKSMFTFTKMCKALLLQPYQFG